VLALWALVTSIPFEPPWWPSPSDWRHYFNFLYPRPIYRPLVLAPIWGHWGILLAATIGRTASHADAPTVHFCQAMRPGRLLVHTILPTALTAIYASREENRLIGVVISLLVLGVAYAAAVIFARKGDGQTRQSLLAVGMVALLAFLAIYRAFWPFIHVFHG
jgi:hypothetical protein